MSEKIKYWWSEDRQWFCIRIKGETVSLTVAEAEELMGEVQQTPSFLALQEEASQRAVELMEQSRAPTQGHSLYSGRENSITAGSDGIGIVERLRFDATRCELQFSKGVAGNINDAAAEIERLRGLVPTLAQSARETALEAAALDFIAKVERGEARSTKSYAAFKAALDTGLPTADDVRGILAAQPPAAPVETRTAPESCPNCFDESDCANVDICRAVEEVCAPAQCSAVSGYDIVAELRDLKPETPILTILDRCIRAADEIDRLRDMCINREEFIAQHNLWKEFSQYLSEPHPATQPQPAPLTKEVVLDWLSKNTLYFSARWPLSRPHGA